MESLVTFCQTSVVLAGYVADSDNVRQITEKVADQINQLEADFGGAWRALEDNSPRSIMNYLEPIFSQLSVSEKQNLATEIIFSESAVFEWATEAWHYCERRNDFIFELLETTFSFQRAVSLYQEVREYLAENSDSSINSILKNESIISFASEAINIGSLVTTGFVDPGFDLVGKGARGLSQYFEPKNTGELIDLVSVSIVKAYFLEEVGVEGVWHSLATNSTENIRELSKKSAQGHNKEYILVWLAALSLVEEQLPQDDEDYLPDEVPNLVGMRLSEAKRLCQAFEIQVDLANGESVWNESNWKVAKISPAPGTAFRKRRKVTFEVKK